LNEHMLSIQDKKFDLKFFQNIYVVAIGKAAPGMMRGLLELLGARVSGGIVLYLPESKVSFPRIHSLPAPHPFPDRRSIRAAQKVLNLAQRLGKKDLLFMLISGGGSSQLNLPPEGISLNQKRDLIRRLIFRGADIEELAVMRTHLSLIKGGRLAQAADPATIISLVLSDVRTDNLEAIASGPTYGTTSKPKDAQEILEKYSIWEKTPQVIKRVLSACERKNQAPHPSDPLFSHAYHFILGNNALALKNAAEEGRRLGFRAFFITSKDQGEARKTARDYAGFYSSILQSSKEHFFPICVVSGGELTVTLKGEGKGGRNQEFILALMHEMRGVSRERPWLALSLGSDGIDGPTDAAGAWISSQRIQTMQQSRDDPQKYLDRNDSYTYFKKSGGLIFTGSTGTNVMDIRIFLTLHRNIPQCSHI